MKKVLITANKKNSSQMQIKTKLVNTSQNGYYKKKMLVNTQRSNPKETWWECILV